MGMQSTRRDWVDGEDPGMNCFLLRGPDGEVLQAATAGTITSASCAVYDLTTNPSALLTTLTNIHSGTRWHAFDVATQDGFWTEDDIGYNVRHYLRASDFSGATALVPGHTYRFVYVFVTDDFTDGSTNDTGTITRVREGTCIPKMAA